MRRRLGVGYNGDDASGTGVTGSDDVLVQLVTVNGASPASVKPEGAGVYAGDSESDIRRRVAAKLELEGRDTAKSWTIGR